MEMSAGSGPLLPGSPQGVSVRGLRGEQDVYVCAHTRIYVYYKGVAVGANKSPDLRLASWRPSPSRRADGGILNARGLEVEAVPVSQLRMQGTTDAPAGGQGAARQVTCSLP